LNWTNQEIDTVINNLLSGYDEYHLTDEEVTLIVQALEAFKENQ